VKKQVPQPTPAQIRKYVKRWDTLEDYVLQEASLNRLFQVLCPQNTSIEDVLLKVSALNDFYSTNIFKTYPVAKRILKLNIDQRIKSGDLALVNQIAKVTISGSQKNFYSFASKYCNHHNPVAFPIYDSYVKKMLMHFKRVDKYEPFKAEDLKGYKRFVEVMNRFRAFYGLHEFSLRQIDIYLWLAGKEYFPNKYY
jgi:hypothetical protein